MSFEVFFEEEDNVSEKGKQIFKRIEDLSLEKGKKLDLTLLVLNRKEVAYLGNHKIAQNDEEKNNLIEELSEEFQEIKSACEELDLLCESGGVNVEDGIVGFNISISKDKEKLNRFSDAEKEGDDRTMGSMLGFPQTSVESYKSERSLDFEFFLKTELSEEERKKLEEEGIIRFLGFQPSKEHWREELDQVRESQALIKEKTPQLYNDIINDKDFTY